MHPACISARIAGRATLIEVAASFGIDDIDDIDDMEGLDVAPRSGETLVSRIGDDRFNRMLQRTVCLRFMLTED